MAVGHLGSELEEAEESFAAKRAEGDPLLDKIASQLPRCPGHIRTSKICTPGLRGTALLDQQ